jgi:quercetin dioxygenase-like cupin family protein
VSPVTVASWDDLEEETVLPGIVRQIVHGERQTMVRYVYDPGSVFPEHAHPEEQVTVVISGTIAFDIAGRRIVLGAGDVAVIPSNVPHGAEVIGMELVETFNALSPRRETGPSWPQTEST